MKTGKHVRRFDLGEMREATRTPQGFLLIPGFATRVGVFTYMDGDGKVRRELRHPDDVFDPASLATLKYAPVTLEHPPDMLTPENVGDYSLGHTTERVEVNRDMVDTDLIVEHQDGIDAVEKDGIRELSSGYHCDIIEEQGTFNGAPYNFRQKNIVYNHLAMVKRGRAGPEVRMRLDSADAVMDPSEISKPTRGEFAEETGVTDAEKSLGSKESETKKVVIAGQEVDLPSHIADIVQDTLDRYDEMRAKMYQLEDEMKARKDVKDVDISQKGVSPQVKVEQQGPDGRASSTKIGAGDKMGPSRAKGDDEGEEKDDGDEHGIVGGVTPVGKADDEEEKDDAEEEGKKDFEGGNAAAGGGAAMSPVAQLKADMDKMKADHAAQMDTMQGKLDEYAAGSMNAGQAKPDRADSFDKKVEKRARQRASLERQAEKLVPFEVAKKFDSMSDDEIRASVVKNRHPGAKLDGKSAAYIESRFDSIVESLDEDASEGRKLAGRHMLEIGTDRKDSQEECDPNQARLRMVQSGRELYKQPLSANKK